MTIVRMTKADLRRYKIALTGPDNDDGDDEPTPSKHRNVPVTIDGIWFQSKREGRRYCELRLLERAGQLHSLDRQVPYPIYAAIFSRDGDVIGLRVVSVYRADFVYRDRDNHEVVEDAKGQRTRMYQLKKKCVEAHYGITIHEV